MYEVKTYLFQVDSPNSPISDKACQITKSLLFKTKCAVLVMDMPFKIST